MQNCKPIASPMTTSYPLSAHIGGPLMHPSFYRSIVGALQYITVTRPNLSYAVNNVY